MEQKKTSVSLSRTPVRRALSRARRSTLLLLLAAGIVTGLLYKAYFKEPAAQAPQTPAATAPGNP